jgi:ABC-type Fe3+-hydroxamate transport system substrate-binding protein
MHLRGPSAALLFIASILLAGLLAGCAGGGDQAGNGGSQGGEGEQGQAAQGEGTQANAVQVKIALGTIVSVKPDRRKIVLRPSTEQQGDRLVFKVVDDAVITLDDQPAEMADVQEGQQAQIEYITVNEQNRARRVELIAEGEGTGG